MKVCTKCGHATADDTDEFCTKCGAYFTDPKAASDQRPTAVGAALGMSAPASREKAVPVPDSGTMEAGFDHMKAGNYAEGVSQWISAIRRDGQPSDEVYRGMLDAMVSCIVSSLDQTTVPSRAGTAELEMELDADMIQDLMSGIRDAAKDVDSSKLFRLTSEYMNLILGSFEVFPDLRDVVELYDRASSDLESMKAYAQDDATALKGFEIAESFAVLMADFMKKEISKAGDERMDALSDYWASKATLPYANIAMQVASLHIQTSSVKAGRLTSKLFKKGMDIQLEAFRNSYFSPKV